ncbi:Catenin-beta-like protein [Ephemerocybe angulata]|uniref:Catenin-beta-like protein n=1 Tax=Ephemerocybe angulata TaxID=980116 RepID=A0A8H6IDJ8_9AGAR|nr:Catenin-beta-like protein [Tulosesus angulatus]
MDIDEIFKVPKFSSSSFGNKRKLPDNPSPEMLTKLRAESGQESGQDSLQPPPKRSRNVTMEEVQDEDSNMEGADFAPGGDADYYAEEDDEGRFFGGGLTSEQKDILSIFEAAGGEGVLVEEGEGLSLTSVRRSLLKLERAANKNQDQRSKYPDDPSRFIDSEADLDSAIKSLLPLAQAPTISYPELVRSGSLALLIGLFTHENVDIVLDVVELIHELTDEDAGEDYEDALAEETEEALKLLIDSLIENSIFELLVDNLGRLNEAEEGDRQGAFHILGIFENILSVNPELAPQLVSKTKILPWLLNRVQAKAHDENRGYAAELLSILLQSSVPNRIAFSKADGVETLLKVLSQYRRRDPVDADETEFMENLFDALCSALSEPHIKKQFLAAEGPDLLILMMKGKLESKSRSIKTLDHAMSGPNGSAVCTAFVEALGLKTLFSAFMGKTKKGKAGTTLPPSEDIGHILGIVSSLFSNLESDSTDRLRLLAKFVENNYEKADKLLDIRDNAVTRLKYTDSVISEEQKDLDDDDDDDILSDKAAIYLRRLDGGLFTLQTVDYILAWIVMEDDGIRSHVLQMLNRKNLSLQDLVSTLKVFYDNMDDAPPAEGEDATPSQKDIVVNLIASLDPSTQQ